MTKTKLTKLIYASEHGYLDKVKALVAEGVDIHGMDNLALRKASARGHLEIVAFLISKGADVHADTDYAIRYASEKGHLEVVQLLVSKGADIHASRNYALVVAYEYGQVEVFDYLLEKGDWRKKDADGFTELDKLEQDGDAVGVVAQVKKYVIAQIELEQKLEEAKRHAEAVAILRAGRKPFVIKKRAP